MRRKKKNGRCAASKVAQMESTSGDEPIRANEGETFRTRVGITIDSYRAWATDPDNISGKAAIDGLVHCGVLRDDTAKEVAWVKINAPQKVKNESEEKTIITIEEV